MPQTIEAILDESDNDDLDLAAISSGHEVGRNRQSDCKCTTQPRLCGSQSSSFRPRQWSSL